MGELKYHTSENASTLPLSVPAAGGEGASWLAENWASESEGEVSHLGKRESMLRKEPTEPRLLPGDGCSSCSCLSEARACSLSVPASPSAPLPREREGGGLLGDSPGTWSGVRVRGRVRLGVRGRITGRVRG